MDQKPPRRRAASFRGTGPRWSVAERPLSEMITPVFPPESRIPENVRIGSELPEPFQSIDHNFTMGLPNHSHVTLTVFNTLGQQVAQLVDGEIEIAGCHEVKVRGSGALERSVPVPDAGGGHMETKRLLLIR